MFPITHIWFAQKVLGFKDSGVVLGSIFPDIVITGCLDYQQTHYCGFGLYHHLKSECSTFAEGMITHTVDPMGLDYYGDERYLRGYKGYCFQKGQQIVNQVIEACNIPESFGLWKAHNFIEMAVELQIYENNPELTDELHKAFLDEKTIEIASRSIEAYFQLDKNEVIKGFKRFSKYIEINKSDSDTLAAKYNLQMQSKHNIDIDIAKAAEIINQSRSLIQPDIDKFFQYCSGNIKRMLEGGDNHE